MSIKWKSLLVIIAAAVIAMPLKADKTSVRIIAPEKAARGSDVTVTIEVTHSGNNFLHYTDWVYLKVNGVENKRWEFSAFNRPESEKFSRSVTLKASERLDLEAQGDCNIHGSQGVATATVQVQ
ncbi:MAG: hypothetical protein JXA20_16510 [Spirochaetes bacterium]|nr:hypothetical protein [Spirochaetota bacterium]